jgi:hypothetical protein
LLCHLEVPVFGPQKGKSIRQVVFFRIPDPKEGAYGKNHNESQEKDQKAKYPDMGAVSFHSLSVQNQGQDTKKRWPASPGPQIPSWPAFPFWLSLF